MYELFFKQLDLVVEGQALDGVKCALSSAFDPPLQQCEEDFFFIREMRIDRTFCATGLGGYGLNLCPVESVPDKDPFGSVENYAKRCFCLDLVLCRLRQRFSQF